MKSVRLTLVLIACSFVISGCDNATYDDCILENERAKAVLEVRKACVRKHQKLVEVPLEVSLPEGLALGDIVVSNPTGDIVSEYQVTFPTGEVITSTDWIDPYDSDELSLGIGFGGRAVDRFPNYQNDVQSGQVTALTTKVLPSS